MSLYHRCDQHLVDHGDANDRCASYCGHDDNDDDDTNEQKYYDDVYGHDNDNDNNDNNDKKVILIRRQDYVSGLRKRSQNSALYTFRIPSLLVLNTGRISSTVNPNYVKEYFK